MKKAKMMLLAIAIVGIAGSSWAFKVQKVGTFTQFGCETSGPNAGKCVHQILVVNPGKVDPNGPFTLDGITASNVNLTCTANSDCGTITYRTDL